MTLDNIIDVLLAALLLWTLISMGLPQFGLYFCQGEFWRAFWFMTGLWGLVCGGIVLYGLLAPRMPLPEMATILQWNAALDVGYIVIGGCLLMGNTSKFKGFGWAIVVQGIFLLGFDSFFAWQILDLLDT